MKQITLYFALLVAFSASNPINTTNRKEIGDLISYKQSMLANVMGGKNISITENNYIASVIIEYVAWFPIGAAVIVNNKWVLTSALNVMLEDYSGVKIRVGSSYSDHGGKLLEIEKYVLFPKQKKEDISQNVALVKLQKPLKFSKSIGVAPLGSKLPKSGQSALSLGFGMSDGYLLGHLQKGTTKFVDNKACAKYYPNMLTKYNYCTNTSVSGPSFFDWGGPLLYKNQVVGLFSFSEDSSNTTLPAIYTDITQLRYKKWIAETIRKD